MPTNPTVIYSAQLLEPLFDSEDARLFNVAIAASQTLARGTVLGEVVASPGTYKAYSSAVLTAPAGAPVPTAVAGAAFPAGVYTVGYTYINSAGETTLSTATVTTSAGNLAIQVAAITPPAGSTGVNYYVSKVAGDTIDLRFAGTSSGVLTTLNTAIAVNAKNPPQVNTGYVNSDGTQNARCILAYDIVTDASGNISYVTSGTNGNDLFLTEKSTSAYYSGTFKCSELVGLDAKALNDLGAFLKEGTVSSGIVRIG